MSTEQSSRSAASPAPPNNHEDDATATTTTPDVETAKRKRQPRNSACQACASLKMKCIASPDAGKCERCHRMNKECMPAVPKPRKRRTQSGIGAVSPKGISISDIVDDHYQSSPPPPFHIPRQNHHDETSKQVLVSKPDITYADSQSFTALFQQSLGIDSAAAELLRGIDYNHVQTSFVVFQQMMANFPFVTLRPDSEAVAMVSSRPMTTLAICTVTTAANAELQERLTQVFRLAMASKVFVARQRGLDLMVGLLIWLAWHHQYMIKQQIYQETCLLAGMAADLGLYNTRATIGDAATAAERNRTFVGCYYLCCGLSMGAFNKPSPMRWTDNLRRFAEELAYSARLPSDRTLVGIVELVRALQELEEDLRAADTMNRSTAIPYIDLHIKAGHQRLKSLRREHPSLAGTLGFSAATIHLHHRLLKRSENPGTTTLIQCACAIKDYIDDLLARPARTLHQVDIVDWTNTLEILVLMARVSKPLPQAVGWEAGAVATMLQPEVILDTVCARMASVPVDDPLAPRMDITFQWFTHVCGGIKKRILQDRGAGGASALRNEDPNIETLGSLGGNFRPVNEAASRPAAAAPAPPISTSNVDPQMPSFAVEDFDSIDMFGIGVLDEAFWNSFMW